MGYGDRLTAGSVSANDLIAKGAVASNDLISKQNEFEETDWTDSNSDGLADGWVCDQGTPTIGTNNQKVSAELFGPERTEPFGAFLKKSISISGALMRLTFTYESNEPIEVYATGSSDKKISEVASNIDPLGEGDIIFEAAGKDGIEFRLKLPDGTDKYMTFFDVKLEVYKTDSITAANGVATDNIQAADGFKTDNIQAANGVATGNITAADGIAQDNLAGADQSLSDQLSTQNIQTDGYKNESVVASGMTMSAQQDYSIDTLIGVDKNNNYNFNYTDLQLDMNTDADTYDFNLIGR